MSTPVDGNPPHSTPSAFSVRTATRQEWEAGLGLMLQSMTEAERTQSVRESLQNVADGKLSLDGLNVAVVHGTVIGAALHLLQADQTAFVWPPVLRLDAGAVFGLRDSDIVESLWSEQTSQLDRLGVRYSQCLLAPGDVTNGDALRRHGYIPAADLEVMDRPLDEPLPPREDRGWQIECFAPLLEERFATVIEQTYEGSRDCPAFTMSRTGRDALDTHQTAGEFDPSRWLLFTLRGDDVGVLLLSVHPAWNSCELVYTGIVPKHRGRGLGRAALIEGLHLARDWNCRSMFLAVDTSNHYAKSIYLSLGFLSKSLQEAWLRWGASGSGAHNPQ